MKILKNVIKVISFLLVIIICITLIRTFSVKSKQVNNVDKVDIDINIDRASNNLAKVLQYKTISYTDPEKFDYNEFLKLHKFIDDTYPKVKENLSKKVINNYSLLYKWEGSNSKLKPLILCAHMDVVGIEKDTISKWKHGPFSGDIAEEKIWGRGARDNKCQMFSILEAVEYLLGNNYKPERTIYLAFGHDEEVTGQNGAANIAKYLEGNNVEAECVIDEGGAIVKNAVPGVDKDVALIGIAEKGYMTLKLSADLEGGHSSDPPEETAINSVSKAISKIDEYSFEETLKEIKPMFEYAAPEANFTMKLVYSNLWLTEGILKKVLNSSKDTASLIKTTKAVTVFNAGFKDNVIPDKASALINFRLMPGEKVSNIKAKVEEIIDDSNVKVELYGYYNDAPESSPVDTESFVNIQRSIKEVFPESISIPFFLSGRTDSKYYKNITRNIYNVTPSIKEDDEVGHGVNERIPVDNYKEYIEFFIQLIKNFQ